MLIQLYRRNHESLKLSKVYTVLTKLPESNWAFFVEVVPFLSLRLDELDAELLVFSLPALGAGILLPTEKSNGTNYWHMSKSELLWLHSWITAEIKAIPFFGAGILDELAEDPSLSFLSFSFFLPLCSSSFLSFSSYKIYNSFLT